jgi:hypothetical protein
VLFQSFKIIYKNVLGMLKVTRLMPGILSIIGPSNPEVNDCRDVPSRPKQVMVNNLIHLKFKLTLNMDPWVDSGSVPVWLQHRNRDNVMQAAQV